RQRIEQYVARKGVPIQLISDAGCGPKLVAPTHRSLTNTAGIQSEPIRRRIFVSVNLRLRPLVPLSLDIAPQPQLRPRLLARLDAGRDEDLQRLSLLQRVDCVVADPDELRAGLAHADLNNLVERALHPGLERHEALLRRLQAHG